MLILPPRLQAPALVHSFIVLFIYICSARTRIANHPTSSLDSLLLTFCLNIDGSQPSLARTTWARSVGASTSPHHLASVSGALVSLTPLNPRKLRFLRMRRFPPHLLIKYFAFYSSCAGPLALPARSNRHWALNSYLA